MSIRDWLLLLALSVLWGGAFFFVEVAVVDIPPLSLVAGRVALAATLLWAVVRARGLGRPRAWRPLLVMGLLNNAVPFSLFFWSQTHIDGGLASILNATTPLFTALLAHVLTTDERLTPRRLAGVALGLAGVAVMVGPETASGLAGDLLPKLACLLAALSYAVAGIYGRRFKTEPPLVTAAGQLTMSALLVLPLALAVDRPWQGPPPGMAALLALVGLAVAGTAVAFTIYFRVLASAGATNVLLVTLLVPVSALLLGTLVLGERIEGREVAGMAGIALGLAAIDGRLVARLTALAGGRGSRRYT